MVNGVDQATFITAGLAIGQHTIGAVYSGDTAFAPSAPAAPLTQTIDAAPLATSTSLGATPNTSTFGQDVTLTAVVTPSAATSSEPTGTVTFTIDGQAESPSTLSMVGSVDQATFRTATLAVGAHTITAAYGGDSVFSSSTKRRTP